MIKISTLEKNFSKILNELMDEKDLTDTTVAKKASIDRGRLGDYKKGTARPSLETCIKLANYFDVSISYLLGETEVRKADNITIGERLGIDDQAIQNIESIKRFNQTFANRYNDIFSDIFTNVDLYKNVINGIDEMSQYKLDKAKNSNTPKEKLKLEHYTELLACQKFLEVYHIYNAKKLFAQGLVNLSKENLLKIQNELEIQHKKVTNQLKAYN